MNEKNQQTAAHLHNARRALFVVARRHVALARFLCAEYKYNVYRWGGALALSDGRRDVIAPSGSLVAGNE